MSDCTDFKPKIYSIYFSDKVIIYSSIFFRYTYKKYLTEICNPVVLSHKFEFQNATGVNCRGGAGYAKWDKYSCTSCKRLQRAEGIEVRQAAAQAMGRIGSPTAPCAFAVTLHESNPVLHFAALCEFGDAHSSYATERLVDVLRRSFAPAMRVQAVPQR